MSRLSFRKFVAVAAVGLGCWIGSEPARASVLLINGNFEDEPNFTSFGSGWQAMTGNQIPGWTIEAGHYATVHHSASGNPTISGTYSLNTDGEGTNGNNAVIYQDFATVAGNSYELGFTWEGWYRNDNVHLNVSLTDLATNTSLFNGLYTSDGLLSAHDITADFAGTGNAVRLLVQESPPSGGNDNLFLVDDFSVTTTAAVPEPASFTLLGMGLLGTVASWMRWSSRSPKVR